MRRGYNSHHTLGGRSLRRGSHPWYTSVLEPRASSLAHQCTGSVDGHDASSSVYTVVYPGWVGSLPWWVGWYTPGSREAYTPCYTRVYTTLRGIYTLLYPGIHHPEVYTTLGYPPWEVYTHPGIPTMGGIHPPRVYLRSRVYLRLRENNRI